MEVIQEILRLFPQNVIKVTALYGIFVVPAYFIIWKFLKKKLQNWRVQMNQRADAAQIKTEILNSVITLLIFGFFDSVIFYLQANGYTKMYTNFSDYGWGLAIGTFFIALIFDDTWFYWTHRLLHQPKIYRFIHAEHHKSIDVTPFTSLSFSIYESIILQLWIIPVAMLIPSYMPAILVFQLYAVSNNLKGHLGYELFPSFTNNTWLKNLTTATHHNLHHSKFNGNYGLHLRFWDRLMGTEFKDYEAVFAQVQNRKKNGVKSINQYYTLTISDIIEETHDAYSLVFKTFPSDFSNYLSGQHITIQIKIDGKYYNRTFSLSSSPTEDAYLQLTIKKVGFVTNFIKENIKIGDTIEALLPIGKFTLSINPTNRNHYFMIAAGSGITPIFSMLKTVLKQEPFAKVTLLYANKSEETAIFANELDILSIVNPNFSLINYYGTNKILRTHLEKIITQYPNNTLHYLCGPKGFMEMVENKLIYLGIDKTQILSEQFTSVSIKENKVQIGLPTAQGTMSYNGEHIFEILENETILEAMVRAEINVPFSCQSGICGTCKCKLQWGKVQMDNQNALTAEEVEEGFILSCQSKPLSKIINLKIQ